MLLKKGIADKLYYRIYETRNEMGEAAASDASKAINELLSEKEEINMIFAAAPSQNEFLAAFLKSGVDFTKINAYHMDEYTGLKEGAPQSFGNFLKNALFAHAPFKSVNYINGCCADIDEECARYTELLKQNPPDIVFMGIGENGHIAFNDPGTGMADFNDPYTVKKVELDNVCRQQQVNDGCFATLDDVPKFALTLTIPTLMSAKHLFCVVPAKTKANALKETINGKIDVSCPASILRTHESAALYADKDSGSLILN